MIQQPIFPPKENGELMDFGEATQHFASLSATEQERIITLLQALVDAIQAGVQL